MKPGARNAGGGGGAGDHLAVLIQDHVIAFVIDHDGLALFADDETVVIQIAVDEADG